MSAFSTLALPLVFPDLPASRKQVHERLQGKTIEIVGSDDEVDALEQVSCTELGCVFSDGVSCLEFSMCQAEMPEQASSSNDGKMNSGTAADVPARDPTVSAKAAPRLILGRG